MNYLEKYQLYNESFLSTIKDFLSGNTKQDDKILKNVYNNFDKIEFQLYKNDLSFNYNGYRFECNSFGTCKMTGKNIEDPIELKSKFVDKLINKATDIDIKKKAEESRKEVKEKK